MRWKNIRVLERFRSEGYHVDTFYVVDQMDGRLDFSVKPTLDHFRNRLAASRTSFSNVWETGKPEVCRIVEAPQKKLLDDILQILEMSTSGECGSMDEVCFKNLWNINLPDTSFRSLIRDIKDGQVHRNRDLKLTPPSLTTLTTGFNFDYRRTDEVKFQEFLELELDRCQFSLSRFQYIIGGVRV